MAGRIFITGDTHGLFGRFRKENWPEHENLDKDDYVIICGDFGGVWDYTGNSPIEKIVLDWLQDLRCTVLFADGNHENYTRL